MPAKSRALAVMSASAGLFIALIVEAVNLLESEDYFQSAATFLHILGLSALAAPATAAILAFMIILALSAFGGMILVLSSSQRSYLGYAWRGTLLVVLWIALYFVRKAMG